MASASRASIEDSRTYELVFFDFRVSGAINRLYRARRAWGQAAEVKRLCQGRAVLVIRPGGAKDLAE